MARRAQTSCYYVQCGACCYRWNFRSNVACKWRQDALAPQTTNGRAPAGQWASGLPQGGGPQGKGPFADPSSVVRFTSERKGLLEAEARFFEFCLEESL